MGVLTSPGRCLLIATLLASSFCNFINFDPGYEYQYKFNSKTQLNRVGDFHVSGKVGYINVGDSVEGQEIYLRVYALGISNGQYADTISHQWDFSKWFSFVITRKGEITHVYHPPDDDEEAVAMKKGFSAMFASRLHHESDVPTERLPEGWRYHVLETGHEGLHNATYTVQPSVEGHVFTKTRHPDEHPVEHATSNYTKTLYYNRELGTVHTVVIDETFQTIHKVADGFDPHSTGRPVKPVNELQDMEFPDMSALALGKLEFLTKHRVHDAPVKGPRRIGKSSIHLGNVKQKKKPVNVAEYLGYLERNLTCMREEPEQGSKRMSMCFSRLASTLKALPDKVVADIAQRYFTRKPTSTREHKDQNFLFDAVAVLENDLSQNLLFAHILNKTRPNQYLLKRLLIHIVSMDTPPIDVIIHKMTQLCFYPPMSFLELLEKDTHQRIVLATGVVARRLWDAGRKKESEDMVKNLEKWLGLHDPYVYRKARSVMKEEHLQLVDHYRVVLLGALGNAALSRSYEHIVSHINSTNSQWVKRAGIHALRKYHHEKIADLMLRTALYDDDEKVRYEAFLQYQAHPKAVAVAPMYMEKGVINGSIFYADPRDVGIHDFSMHHRDKRSVEDFVNKKWEYNLKSPSVDWQKMIGSTKIGAAFGLIIKNELDLKFSLLNSHARLDIHDETYARVHLGFMGKTLELFFGRVCFKGGASYDMNMMKDNAKGDLKKLFDLFFNIKDNAIKAIGSGTELFKSLTNGDVKIDHIFEDFKTALEELPGKFTSIVEKAGKAITLLGEIDEKDLPPFVRPMRNLVLKITSLVGSAQGDVMTFFNSLMETVTVVIPTAAKEIFKDINKVITSFRTFDKNPKAAISNIAASVMSVKNHVTNVIKAVMDVKDKCSFIHGKKPDWMKMDGPIGEIISLAKTAFTTLGKGGVKWVMESITNDEIASFSHGKTSMHSEKKRLVELLNEILDEILGPLKGLKNMGTKFLGTFQKVYRVVMDIKEAYNLLKNGFGSARSLIDRLFGPKFHKDFPNSMREKGGGCTGFGTYHSRLGTGTEYAHDGVDVRLKTGENIISPFHGLMTLSDDPNEVILDIRGGSLKDTHIYITNIKPNDTITRSEPVKVLRGQVIGVSTESPCKGHDHIHVSMKRDGGFIDPTNYLEPRVPGLPAWNQECDDYKVVLKMDTIAEGCIICLDGKNKVDTSPEQMGSGDDTMIYQLISGSFGGGGGGGGGGGIVDKITANIDKLTGSADNALSTLFKNAVKFIKNFSIRNIKLGSIIDVLDVLELNETKKHVAEVIKSIKVMMDTKPCLNPYQYTDKQLRAELRDRGKKAIGSRDDMIKVLTTPSTVCPLWNIAMPKSIFCTFDNMCLGVECCVYFKAFMFRFTYKVYARFDPCTMAFHLGAGTFNTTIKLPIAGFNNMFSGLDQKFQTGLVLEVLGGIELIIRVKLEKSEKAMLVSLGAGFCSVSNLDKCQGFFYILDKAVTPLPMCNPDGTITWPDIDYKSLLDFGKLKEKLKHTAFRLAKDGIDRLLTLLPCISPDAPGKTTPCSRPTSMTDHMLKDELKKEGSSTEGTHEELVQRLGAIHKSCKYDGRPVTLPPIPNEKIDKMVYIKLTSDCMRIDLCADLAIPQLGFSKTVTMFVDTKPCSLKLILGFEECSMVFSLLGYEWGKPKIYRLNDHVGVRYKVGLDEFQENFRMSLGLLIDIGEGTPLLDAMFFNDVELPIPKCNGRTHLAENSTIMSIAASMGGKLNKEATDYVIDILGLKEVFTEGECNLPSLSSRKRQCTTAKPKYTPSVPLPKGYDSTPCQLTCGGVHCCVNYTFDMALFRTPPVVNLPVFLNFDPCELIVEIGYGKYKHTEKLLAYNWGTEAVLEVGKGNSTPVYLQYKISKADKDFKIDFNVSTCLTIDFDTYCYPKDGLILMDQQTISGCDHKVTLQKNKFTMTEWLTSLDLDPNLPKLPRTTADLLLKKFPINDKLLKTRCDQTRPPYTPQVDGWRNECPRSTRKLTKLPEGVRCHLAASCTRIECCFEIAYLGMSFCTHLNVDVCQQSINAAIEKTSINFNLLKEKASLTKGVSKSLDIAKVFKMSFDVKKNGGIIKADYDVKVCFEEDKCLFEANILSATELPPPLCTALDTSKFSLKQWASKKGIDLSGGLQPSETDLLLEQLGVKDKMLDPPCDRNGLKFKPAGPNQWKNDCAKPKYSSSLSKLSLPVNCHLNTDCLAVECCLDSKTLGRTIQVSFNIDMCDHYIEGSIEQFMFKVNMPDYRWGERKEMTFSGVHIAKMKFRIERLQSQDVFAVDLTASMCFEQNSCEVDVQILDKAFLPIPSCPSKQGYHDREFSVKQWVANRGGAMNAQLSADILNELDITRFLQTGQCQSYSQPFKDAKDGWKKDCPRSVSLNPVPQAASCHLSDTCTGVSCCLEASEVKRNFKTFLTIDACSNSMTVGIEKLMFSYSLFDYDWGKAEVIDLHGLIKVEFNVKKHRDQKAFIADLKLKVCPAARQSCPTTITVLENTLLTSQPCKFELLSPAPGFQISDYVSSMTATLDTNAEKRLLAGLGVAHHMKAEACSFLGRGSNGWSSSCGKSVTLDNLPESTSCEMSASCMNVDCCLDVPLLARNINYRLDLDVCKSTLNLAIENVKYQKVLFKYHWGSADSMHLKGVFRADFIIDYFNTQKEIALTLNISACFDSDKPCQLVVPVARHTKLPVPDCNTGTPLQDFSLAKWKRENNIVSSMTPVQRSRLETAMDISQYVLDPMCNRTKGKFKPQSQGWNNACARDIALKNLPDGVSCYIPEHCTAVECCITSAKLERTFNVKVNVDHNNQVLGVGIEKLVHQRSLHTYNWGTEENFNLNGVAKMKYKIQDLKRSRKYLMSLSVSVCTEAGQPCDKDIEVLTGVLLPRLTRDWNSKETVPGFTFKKWRSDFNVPTGTKLTAFQQRKLLNDLDLLDHLDETSCDLTASPYDEATDGWNNECTGDVEVGTLPPGIACHLNSNCHSLQCCVKDDTLGRSFNVKIDIEACASRISMTIERLVFVRSFSTYSWGRVEHFNLKDVIRADVLIDDLRGQDKFLLVANMSVCLEKDSCLFSANVLKKAMFSKDICELDSLETLKEFPLDTFLSDNGATGQAKLSPLVATQMYGALDLARFLKAPQCDTKAAPYTGGTNGWKKDCSLLKKEDGFSAVPTNVACHLGTSCTSINCCVFIDLLSRNFNFALSVDACNYKMTIALEKHEHHQMLMDYEWGTEEHFYLKGVLRMDYTLNQLPQERSIEATVSIRVCLKESECLFSHKLLDKAKLPQPSCEWTSKVNSQNFSLEKWVEARGVPSAQTELSDSLVAQLLEDLGMSSYLPVQNSLDIMLDIESPYCKRDESPFSPHNVHNWNKDCKSVDVPSLDKSTNCYLSSNCMSVECCSDLPHIRRSLKTLFAVDICAMTVEMKLERLTFNLSLLEYEWGTTAHFSIGSFIILEYKMDHNPTALKITVNLKMKVCFEKQCEKDFPIMSNSEITYSPCGPEQTVPLQGLSLDFYNPDVCKFGVDLNTCSMKLPSNLDGTCRVTDSCMGVRCCVPFDLQHLGVYSVSTGIEADHCADKFEYHVENKKWSKNLKAMTFDKNVTEQVGDGLTLSYIVSKSVAMIELSFSLKVCVKDSPGSPEFCQYKVILDKVIFQTSTCGFLGRKKRSYMSDMVKKNVDVNGILSGLMEKTGITNNLIKKALDAVQDFPDVNDIKYDIGDRKESAENPSTALNLMGNENPKTIIYSGKALGGSYNVGIVGGGKVVKMLGKALGVLGRGKQAYTIGSGLTQAGMELLGAKLANMSIGELLALSEELTISPDTAFKISMQLRDLAMAVYSEVIQTVINGDFTDFFKSFDVILEGKFEIPRQNINFFSQKWFFLVGGIVPMTFDFGIGASLGIKMGIGAQVLALKAKGQVTPYVGAHTWGELGIGFVLYGKLRLEGYLLTLAFPTVAEIQFTKWPLSVRVIMDLEFVPIELSLYGIVTLEVDLKIAKITKVLFQAKIFGYTSPVISTRIFDLGSHKEDDTPPHFLHYIQHKGARRRRARGKTESCFVRQVPGKDYTEPTIEVAAAGAEDRGIVDLYLEAGTQPGLDDVFAKVKLGGPSLVINHELKPHGVPLYFTILGVNHGDLETPITCSIPTYDITPPGGRLTADFLTTSNPSELRASLVVYEDSVLNITNIGVGVGKGMYADEVVPFSNVNLRSGETNDYDPSSDKTGEIALTHFSGVKTGRLIGPVISITTGLQHAGLCAMLCLQFPPTKCLSMNYDYSSSGTCELLEAIEGHDFEVAISGQFAHFERLGVGLAHEFVYKDLSLRHNTMYYFSMHLVNTLNFSSFIHSRGVIVDVTPPEPGPLAAIQMDTSEVLDCHSLLPENRPEWAERCKGVNSQIKNHRLIMDGPGSMTLFNGEEPLTDLKYTRANNYVAANWDGITDVESGILGYSWSVGTQPCEDLIHPHHDPHKHLFDEAEWTHTGLLSPLPDEFNPLPDGKYYVTLRTFNKVEYGGPLVTTVCHTTPFCIDNTPPIVYEVYNIAYEEKNHTISAEYNVSDPESGVRELDLCLGQTTRDCYHMPWQRSTQGDGKVNYQYEIPGGKPVWIKVRAINNVDLKTVDVADHPIIIDNTPPVAGVVYDGDVNNLDLNYTMNTDKVCVNWLDFNDPESGIAYYDIVVQDSMGTPITEVVSVDHKTSRTCITLHPERLLQHLDNVTVHITAFNAGHRQQNISAKSNGVIVDMTAPIHGDIVDGRSPSFRDQKFSTHKATVGAEWRGFSDPESSLRQYAVQILRAKDMSSEFEVLKDWKTLDTNISQFEWHNFNLGHRDVVKTKLRTTNNALASVEQTTDGFVVDLTPPRMTFIGDGSVTNVDAEFQESDDKVEAVFNFFDNESGLEHFKYQVYELHEGSRHQIYPPSGGWETIHDWHATSLKQHSLSLRAGAMYSVRVGAVNRAGAVSTYDTNGVLLDNTKPEMHWVYVGIFAGSVEEFTDGYVIQSDPTGIKATWFGEDTESGIARYHVAVGTTKERTDILDWTDVGPDKDKYISDLTLNITDPVTMTPVYYVKVMARNGAGMDSAIMTSHPIKVVDQDKAGIVIDGGDGTERENYIGIGEDRDYQTDAGVVTVQFAGFESHEHGVTYYDWAVGTTPGGEEVQPFIMAGLSHDESESNVPGRGLASTGFGQAALPLKSGVKYYTTVRGITNGGNILESTSDGFIVDQTPPTIQLESFALEENQTRLLPDIVLYQSEVDSLSAAWKVKDADCPIKKVYFSVGSYPYADDIYNMTEIQSLTGEATLPPGIKPTADGRPNILTITAVNEVGLSTRIISPSLIVDVTPPTKGELKCPSFIQPLSHEECTWTGFHDDESAIVSYEFSLGSDEGLEDVIPPVSLPVHTKKFLIQGLSESVSHGQSYYAVVKAINSVGKIASIVSKPISVDTTPPKPGTVVELKSDYRVNVSDPIASERLNIMQCDNREECLQIEATCQESLTGVGVAWEAFHDEQTAIVKYEIAVGTTPGGGELKSLFEVDNVEQRYTYVTGLMLKGHRKVYVTVKGTNGAGLSTISTSPGIYLSYLSQGLEPLTHVGVMDGDSQHGDLDYQTSLTSMSAQWDVSGDPCPVVKYEWAIQRADGLVVQDFVDTEGRTFGVNDQLTMKNKQRYYQLLRVTNALGFTYTLRSNGITVRDDPLVPGHVNDGDVIGYDLQFVRTTTKVSANWDMFGSDGNAGEDHLVLEADGAVPTMDRSQASNQEVVFYEVALGTDRRFDKTRENVVPFTDVGLNKSVTFYDLELVTLDALYYFTVRAHSASGSTVEVTSNGFAVGFDDGTTAGLVKMGDYISTTDHVEMRWEKFESNVGVMMYYAGLADTTKAEHYHCGEFTEMGVISKEERQSVMNIADVHNVGRDTFVTFTNLTLLHNTSYYVWVIGVNKAGVCNMTCHRFTVDASPPTKGKIRAGPYYDLASSYAAKPTQLTMHWKNFNDGESGIKSYSVALLKNISCGQGSPEELVVEALTLDINTTSYTFMDLNLQRSVPYFVRFTADNNAGLSTTVDSAPVLYDDSTPSPGHVVDGHDFTTDVSWMGSANEIKGTFLHHPIPDSSGCPGRPVKFDDREWKFFTSDSNFVGEGKSLSLTFRRENVHPKADEVQIKLARDTKKPRMFSGGYYRNADLLNGGVYKMSIKAAGEQTSQPKVNIRPQFGGMFVNIPGAGKPSKKQKQDSRPVTSVVFWDGPEDYILNNDFTPTPSWADSNCACCEEEPVQETCKCNCEEYMLAKNHYRRIKTSESSSANTTSTTTTTTTTTPTTTVQENGLHLYFRPPVFSPVAVSVFDVKRVKENKDIYVKPKSDPQDACGIQLFKHTGEDESVKGRLVAWCIFKDPMMRSLETVRDLDVDPSLDYHDYTISFTISREEAKDSAATWCMKIEMDGEDISNQCGIPHLSSNTSIFLGIWNHKNYMPETRRDGSNYLRVWEQRASFRNMEFPPDLGKLCRYGNPFRGGNNAIVRYEAGIGLKSGQNDVVPFRPVYSPCVPCLRPCDTYSCNTSCDKSRTEQVRFSLTDLSLNTTATLNGKTEPIPYYLTVKAVLGSGLSAVSSSDGFSVDTTPPYFDLDLMLYMDVYQGNFTPSSFQGSNDTIKAVWKCSDNESEIVNYEWAIGRIPGGDELQTFMSTGENPGGENAGFAGILRHNITYYVTVRCTNGGGLSTTYKDKKGVTVLLEDPVVDDVNTTIDGAEPFADDVIPDNAMKTDDQNSVGASWTISKDPSIKRYDFCVGSSASVPDDIFPCTWVGYNQSGTATIEDGYLKLNGERVQKLNQYRPDASDWINDPFDKTRFTMAPGMEMFIFMKMCNEAGRCTAKLIGSSFVETKSTHLAVTGPNGLPVSIMMDGEISLRRKRAASKVSVETPAGLKPGQSVAVTVLNREDLEKDYRSDASTEFVAYITDPVTTATDPAFMARVLRKRINYSHGDTSFSITSVGGLAMSGPLTVTFPYDQEDTERKYKLLHWNPDTQKWHDSSQTCPSELNTEVEDPESSVIKVKVCGTRGGNQATRRRRSASASAYFSQPTQFLITPVLIQIPNDRPSITGHSLFEIDEDQGTMVYMLEAADGDGDDVRFRVDQDDIRVDNLTLSENGLLMYTPTPDFSGVVDIPVVLYEVPVDGVPPTEVTVNVTIIVVSVADAPAAFAASDNDNILNPDHTEPILTFLEQERANDTSPTVYSWQFGAYDVDGDNMTMYFTQPDHGYLTVGDVVTTSPDCSGSHASDLPCSDVTIGQRADSVSWIYRIFRYEPDTEFYGFDETRIYVQDQTGLYSDIITLTFAVMEWPCQNEAKCKSKNPDKYTCTDYRRAEGFHQYYICDCAPGWTNTNCDTDIDECINSPCAWPYVCHDAIGRYDCACPESDPNCDGLEAWMIGLVVLTLLLLVVISFLGWYSFMVKRGRLKWSTLWRRIAGEAPDVSETKTAFVNSACDEVEHGTEKTSKSDKSVKKLTSGGTKNRVSTSVANSAPLKYSVDGNISRPTTPREVTVQPKSNHASSQELTRPSTSKAMEWTRSVTPVERSMTPVEQCDERPGSGNSLLRSTLQRREGSIVLTDKPSRDSDL